MGTNCARARPDFMITISSPAWGHFTNAERLVLASKRLMASRTTDGFRGTWLSRVATL